LKLKFEGLLEVSKKPKKPNFKKKKKILNILIPTQDREQRLTHEKYIDQCACFPTWFLDHNLTLVWFQPGSKT
jgi:hypothetical protein